MQEKKNILAICGSAKTNSTNEAIIRILEKMCTDEAAISIYDISRLPFFIADSMTAPQEVSDFRHQVESADAVIICTPEYIYSLPGILKNALEWTVSSSSFSQKPVALIVASSAGEKAYESLILIMATIEAKYNDQTCLLIRGAKSKIEKSDAQTIEKLKNLMSELMKMIFTH